MRVLVVVGVVVLALGAVTVPLPWTVVDTSTLLPAAAVTAIQIDPGFAAAAGGGDRTVSGEYLVIRHRRRAPLVRLLVAAAVSGSHVQPPLRDTAGRVHPVVAAAMAGLGIVPRHADAGDLPVSARVDPTVDAQALGIALHAFDVGSRADLAGGRRILALGRVVHGGVLECAGPVVRPVRTAAAAGVDVVVLPSECAADAADALPAEAAVEVIDASVLSSAAEALLTPRS